MKVHAGSLQVLTERLNAAREEEVFTLSNCPFSPQSLIQASQHAFDATEVDFQVRAVIYQEIERLILEPANILCDSGNNLLRKHGILPNLKPAKESSPAIETNDSDVVSASATASLTDSQDDDQTFSMLRKLLRSDKPASSADDGPEEEISTAQVLKMLADWPEVGAPVKGKVEPEAAHDLAEQLRQHISDHADNRGRRVSPAADDTIALVSMLFRFILDDRQLAPPIAAQVSRLQLPVLRLALSERKVFSDNEHPARRLLNDISTECIGWTPQATLEKDPLYREISKVVDTLCSHKHQEEGLYAQQVDQFRAYVNRANRKAALLQERLAGAEHAKALADEARNVVNRVAQRRLERFEIPGTAASLINGSIRRWLQWVYLREGVGSDDWKNSLVLLDRFVACFADVDSDETSDERRERFDKTVADIGVALDTLGDDLMLVRQQLGAVHKSHEKLINPYLSESELEEISNLAADPQSQEGSNENAVNPATNAAEGFPSPAPDAQTLERVDRLKVETWFQLDPDDAAPMRCYLAVILPSANKYVFMNRAGMKVAEFGREQLGWALLNGSLEVIPERQIFDSALESVIGNLRGTQP